MSVHVTLDVSETAHDICQDIQNANIDFLLTVLHILLRKINNLAKLILRENKDKILFTLFLLSPQDLFPSVLLEVQVHLVDS